MDGYSWMNVGDYLANKARNASPVTKFFMAYLLALFALVVMVNISPDLALLLYFICGFALNRYILSKMRWHVIQATLSNIAMAKLSALLLWPIVYPILLVQLLIARYF